MSFSLHQGCPAQTPRPGHKGKRLSVPHHGPEGRQPASLVVRDLEPERFVELPFPFIALAESLQHSLLGTGVGGLFGGRTYVEVRFAPRRGDFNSHRALDALEAARIPELLLQHALRGAGNIQPHGGQAGWLAGKVPANGAHPRPPAFRTVSARQRGLGLRGDPAPPFRVDAGVPDLVRAPLAKGGHGLEGPARSGGGL